MTSLVNGPQVSWQSLIRQRLEERDGREKAFDEMVDNCQCGGDEGRVVLANMAHSRPETGSPCQGAAREKH